MPALRLPRGSTKPEEMTGRARVYLLATFASHLALALVCIVRPGSFRSSSYEVNLLALPLPVWGAGFAATAVLCLVGAVTRDELAARAGLVLALTTTGAWCAGMLAVIFIGQPAGPTGPIIWGALAVKDGLQCRMPLRTPFEPLAREVLDSLPSRS